MNQLAVGLDRVLAESKVLDVEGVCRQAPSSGCIRQHSECNLIEEITLEDIVEAIACPTQWDVLRHHRHLRMVAVVVIFLCYHHKLHTRPHIRRKLLELDEEQLDQDVLTKRSRCNSLRLPCVAPIHGERS